MDWGKMEKDRCPSLTEIQKVEIQRELGFEFDGIVKEVKEVKNKARTRKDRFRTMRNSRRLTSRIGDRGR